MKQHRAGGSHDRTEEWSNSVLNMSSARLSLCLGTRKIPHVFKNLRRLQEGNKESIRSMDLLNNGSNVFPNIHATRNRVCVERSKLHNKMFYGLYSRDVAKAIMPEDILISEPVMKNTLLLNGDGVLTTEVSIEKGSKILFHRQKGIEHLSLPFKVLQNQWMEDGRFSARSQYVFSILSLNNELKVDHSVMFEDELIDITPGRNTAILTNSNKIHFMDWNFKFPYYFVNPEYRLSGIKRMESSKILANTKKELLLIDIGEPNNQNVLFKTQHDIIESFCLDEEKENEIYIKTKDSLLFLDKRYPNIPYQKMDSLLHDCVDMVTGKDTVIYYNHKSQIAGYRRGLPTQFIVPTCYNTRFSNLDNRFFPKIYGVGLKEDKKKLAILSLDSSSNLFSIDMDMNRNTKAKNTISNEIKLHSLTKRYQKTIKGYKKYKCYLLSAFCDRSANKYTKKYFENLKNTKPYLKIPMDFFYGHGPTWDRTKTDIIPPLDKKIESICSVWHEKNFVYPKDQPEISGDELEENDVQLDRTYSSEAEKSDESEDQTTGGFQ
eukprot:GHVP01068434.1.p1 GENE.GHVP01068434.1~~GHVP01068434.1.p1  ORF type:complete len:548 (+),score=89.57 GHVP01068434.1:16-1659(+)